MRDLVLVRIGELEGPARVFQEVKAALEAHLPVKCSSLDSEGPLPLPRRAWDSRRRQYRVQGFLRLLKGLKLGIPESSPSSKAKLISSLVLGITDVDLYSPGLNFVFGSASPAEGVAVISLYRLHPEFYGHSSQEGLLLRRARKEAVHEVGHLLGLGHCPNPRCVMSFSNSILDVDRKGEGLCDRCRRIVK